MSWLTSNWSLGPALIYVVIAAVLYVLGGLRQRRGAQSSEDWLRVAAFAGGLLTIVIALDSPLDYYADQLFWVHMIQHILLLTVAPPLILLGRPWPRMWRALPLQARTKMGRTIARARWTAPLRAIAKPLPSFILFSGMIIVWHIPAAYNLTLTNNTVHNCEHALFFFTGLLFWAHMIDPGPLRRHSLNWPTRCAYLTAAMIVGWVLAIVLVLAKHPLYGHYAALAHRPGGLTALEDQQIAGGMMWVPGSVSYTIAVIFAFWRWAAPDGTTTGRRAAPAL